MNLVDLESVGKNFNVGSKKESILKDINLTIQEGEFVVLKGKNGVGKSTLIHLILGLIKPSSGSVKLMGLSPQNSNSKTSVGVVLQQTELPKRVKVKELIELWRSYYPNILSTQEILQKVNLEYKADAWANDLSGGQKQRLLFALALTGNPQLLILDEPTRNLDDDGYKEFWQQIQLCVNSKIAILMVTNNACDWNELKKLTQRTIVLDKIDKSSSNPQLINNEDIHSNSTKQISLALGNKNKTVLASLLISFKKLCWFEAIQLLRTPAFLIAILPLVVVCTPFLKSQNLTGFSAIPIITSISGMLLFSIVIERLGNRVAVERAEKWFKLLRVTPLHPIVHITAKVSVILVVCSLFLLSIFFLSAWQLNIQVALSFWFSLFISLILGIVPFAFLGLALGYFLNPVSAQSVLSWSSLIAVPVLTGAIPPVAGYSIFPDLISLSPFYHYRQLILWSSNQQYDDEIFLHCLWLIWACMAFSFICLWSYQREKAIE